MYRVSFYLNSKGYMSLIPFFCLNYVGPSLDYLGYRTIIELMDAQSQLQTQTPKDTAIVGQSVPTYNSNNRFACR